jgi:hypothetical protein
MRRPAELVPGVETTHAPFPCQDREVALNHTSLRKEVVVEERGISALSDQTCSRYCGCCVKCIMQCEVIASVYVVCKYCTYLVCLLSIVSCMIVFGSRLGSVPVFNNSSSLSVSDLGYQYLRVEPVPALAQYLVLNNSSSLSVSDLRYQCLRDEPTHTELRS